MGFEIIKWDDERVLNVIYHLALLGATDIEVANTLNVSVSAITNWKRNNPDFLNAYNKGKLQADMKVVGAYFMNTQDRYVEVEEVHVYRGVVTKVKRQQFIQGDKWVQSQWLAKRRRGDWTDAQKIEINHTNTNINFDFSGMTIEEMKVLEKFAYHNQKELPKNDGGE